MNIKKTFIKIASLVLAFSSLTASAAVYIPQPKDNNEAYAYALAFYKDGYYYEAKQELEKVNPDAPGYEPEKTKAWMEDIDAKIEQYHYDLTRIKIKEILANVKKYNSELKFGLALQEIYKANDYVITVSEYESLLWWENAVKANMSSLKYAPVNSNMSAIALIKADGQRLPSENENYYAIKVAADEWHVYITTRTPDGSKENVAAFRVYANGTYVQVLGNDYWNR